MPSFNFQARPMMDPLQKPGVTIPHKTLVGAVLGGLLGWWGFIELGRWVWGLL